MQAPDSAAHSIALASSSLPIPALFFPSPNTFLLLHGLDRSPAVRLTQRYFYRKCRWCSSSPPDPISCGLYSVLKRCAAFHLHYELPEVISFGPVVAVFWEASS